MFKYILTSVLTLLLVGYLELVAFRPSTKILPAKPTPTTAQAIPVPPTITPTAIPTPSLQVTYQGIDDDKVKSYNFTSIYNGNGPHVLRVLEPNKPAVGVAHNFLYLLPVVKENPAPAEDVIEILRGLNAQNKYNLTIILPSFSLDPWYADHPTDPNLRYESFMVKELQPWVKENLSKSGSEQHWLLGLSKSGLGAIDLLFRHPNTFTLAAAWDFPADMPTFDQYNAALIYGTADNYQSNYQLTADFLETYKKPFLTQNRIWISGFSGYESDISDLDKLLTQHGLVHTTGTPMNRAHIWGSGWIPEALSALNQLSPKLLL